MSAPLQKELEVFTRGEQNQETIRSAADTLHKHFGQLHFGNKRDDLRALRVSAEKMLERDDLNQGTRTSIKKLHTRLAEEAVEAPLLPADLGKQAGEKMPDFAKKPVEVSVNALNETVQRTYEEGKSWWRQSEGSPLARAGLVVAAAAGIYVLFKGVAWLFKKTGNGLNWLWKRKWTVLTLGLVGYAGYKYGQSHPAEPKRPEAKLGGEDILGKEQKITVDGKERSLKIDATGELTLDGKRWKLSGLGVAKILQFNILQAVRNGDSATLRVKGSGKGIEKQQDIILDKKKIEDLIHDLDKGTPKTFKVPTGISPKLLVLPTEVEIALVKV